MAALKFVRSVSDSASSLSCTTQADSEIRYGSLSEQIQVLSQGKSLSVGIYRIDRLTTNCFEDY